jgi:hypothetical protein
MCSLVSAGACKKPSTPQEEPPTVPFDIKLVGAGGGPLDSHLYNCTYQAGGKTAKFRLELKQHGPMSGEIPMASAEGKFLAVTGSDNSVLLEDLKKALEAKEVPKRFPRIAELPFDVVILAQRESRDPSGAFLDQPPGDWVLLKVFLPKGRDDGEVYLHLNPVLGKAEFSMKDSDYGDYVLGQLARVL